jgi:hypothetical protein
MKKSLETLWLLAYMRTKNKLRGPLTASELYRLNDRHLSTKFSAKFCGEGCHVVRTADPLTNYVEQSTAREATTCAATR